MAQHTLQLLNIILTQRYNILSDSSGKPVVPSSKIYEDLSNDFKNETGKMLSPKYIYTILQGNIYEVWNKFLNYHNIEKFSTSISNISEESTLHDSYNDNKIELQLILPFKTWLAMGPEEVEYSDKTLSERSYNVLLRRIWTDVLFEQLWQQIHIPCALSFKRCKMSDSGIFLKIVAACSECNCSFSGIIANKPIPSKDVVMECVIENFNASIKHKKKRHLKGKRRIEISNKMLEGNILPCIWRRNEANKIMKFGDSEPAHLPKNQILSKAKQEREKINLALTTSDPLQNLQCMKYNRHAGQIHAIGLDPFYVHYWTLEQIAIFVQNSEYICIDGTGSLVKKLKKPSGELSSHIYLYQIVTKTDTSYMPVFQMLSASQNTNTIHFWLVEIIRIGMKHKPNFPLPKQVVCDFDRALIGAIVRAFCQCKNLQNYLSQCFICLNGESKNLPPTFLRLDISHFIHMISRWKELKIIHPQARLFYITIMAFLTKISNFEQFQDVAKCAIVLTNSEMFGNTKDNIPSYAEHCFKKLHTVVTQNIVPCEIIDAQKDETKRFDDFDTFHMEMEETQNKSDITAWLATFSAECIAIAKDNAVKNPGCNVNPYYSIGIGKRIISLLLYFPLYSNVMVPIFNYGSSTATSSAVEAEFNDCKHRLFKNISRPMRVDKFVTLHLQSFSGRAKFAIAEQTSETKNAFEKNKNIENKTKEKERDSDIIPCTLHPQQNLTCTDIQLIHTMYNENVQTDKDITNVTHNETSQTIQTNISNTDEKENYEYDTVSSDKSENEYSDLNDEHNWRNKNERGTRIKRTYLQPRPDFIGVCKRKKIDIAILQNGNLCESLKDGKDRLVIINTCGFDSIVQLFATACIHTFFHNTLVNATSDIFQFIKNFIDRGPCKLIYRQRATLLRKIEYFVSKNANVITINALSNVSNLCDFFFNEEPSCTLLKECDNCKKTITRNLTLFNLDFETIQLHGYDTIAQAIQNYTTNNYKKCTQCGENVKLKANYHSHLLIECIGDANIKIPLKTFPKTITLHDVSFSLVGVIHYIGGRNVKSAGHYTAYSLHGDKWILFDDLLKKCLLLKTIL